MKLSVSLPEHDVAFIDRYAAKEGVGSRSAVVQRAVALLRTSDLVADYEAAFEEWHNSGEDEVWETVVGDGLEP